MFETTTDVMYLKLRDALWPFHPENQPQSINPKNNQNYKGPSTASPLEMYGPLWICVTLIIEILVLGHLSKLLNIEMGWGGVDDMVEADKELIETIVKRFGGANPLLFDPSSATANEALTKVIRVAFIVIAYFILVPVAVALTFASSQSI